MKKLFAGLVLLFCANAHAADGNYLAKLSDAHDRAAQGAGSMVDAVDAGRLEGFVMAVADDAIGIGVVCTPGQVSYEQLVAVTKKAIREQPDRWHFPGHIVVQMALMKAFPCKK